MITPRSLSERALAALDARAQRARRTPVPDRSPARQSTLVAHALARAWTRSPRERHALAYAALEAAVDLALLEGSALLLGRGALLADGGPLLAPSFLPDYHGPHFQRALRRLFVPNEGPFVVHLSLTGACPWTCRYCFASAGGPSAPDVGEAALVRVARALAEQRVPIVILGGGEPLGRFERALALIEALSGASEVRLATSGSGLTAARAARLERAGLNVIAISLDSHERDAVDRVRGEGAFDAALGALSIAAGTGLSTLVTAVVRRDTFAKPRAVEALLELVARTHPRAIVNFLPEFSTGRSAEGFASPEEFAPYGRHLARVIRDGGHRAACFYGPAMDLLVGCVGAGQRQLVIDTRANLCACVSGASFGNLLDEPFDAVWARMLAAPARLKRGYFCSSVNSAPSPLPDGEASMLRALEAFHATAEDTALQRFIDGAAPIITRALRDR